MVALNLGMAHYWLDHAYGALMHRMKLAPPFFSRGWGGRKLELLERVAKLQLNSSSTNWPPPLIRPRWRTLWESRTGRLEEGTFLTPCLLSEDLRHGLPVESYTARVTLLTPRHTHPSQTACVVHLAGNTCNPSPLTSALSPHFLRLFSL